MNYCSQCGANTIQWTVPADDNRHRHVCSSCHEIYYQNPKIVVGCIPEWGEQVLLCKRAIQPRLGYWTLPAGFMENDETTLEAAERETWEEATAKVQISGLYAVMNIAHTNQVYMMFRAQLIGGSFAPGSESLECALYEEHEMPWSELAFPTITHTLRLFYEDRKQGQFDVHLGDIVRSGRSAEFVHRLKHL